MRDGNVLEPDQEQIDQYMRDCSLCPRQCHADRMRGEIGYCGQGSQIKAAQAALHMWEEPCLSGTEGSGTVFFTGCTLGCVYCQNHRIADGTVGKNISVKRLADIFLELQEQQALNINLVTAGHFAPQVVAALKLAKEQGLRIPVVYNTSGYERVETLKLLQGYVDIYLPDFKYMDHGLAKKYSFAADYPQIAKEALAEMVRQTGEPQFNGDQMTKGVIVRHLVLPGLAKDSKKVIRYLQDTYEKQIFISIMNQYTPMSGLADYPELLRKLTEAEYDEIVDYAIKIGVEQGFIQEGNTAEESFIPSFDITGI